MCILSPKLQVFAGISGIYTKRQGQDTEFKKYLVGVYVIKAMCKMSRQTLYKYQGSYPVKYERCNVHAH